MGNLKRDLKRIYQDKAYVLLLALTAACGYGFKIAHPVMGIDDTPYAYYFEEGLAAVVGRWVLFVLNKVIHLSDFAPFITDFAAVLLLMLAVTVWGLLFYAVFGERIPKYGYWFFSCIFLSCPLIAEVFTYYLHNGIAIGYLSCGISLYLFREGLNQLEGTRQQRHLKQAVSDLAWSAVTLVIALGCYESFMIVWLVGVMLLLLSERIVGMRRAVVRSLCAAAAIAVCSMVLRAVVLKIVMAVFDLSYLQDEAVQRSVTELLGWMLEPGAKSEFAMILKRLFVMYGVFAYAYYPIKIFVAAAAVIVVYSLWRSIRLRDIRIVVCMLGSFAAAFLLAVVEGKATLYRSAQFLPLVCAYGILLTACAVSGFISWVRAAEGKPRLRRLLIRVCSGLFLLCAASVLWNQCTDLNRWFYVDYQKYEYTKEYLVRVAEELERNFDTSKPVVFTGEWENPKSLVEDAYVDYGSETFYRMKRITDLVDEHLLEKFYRDYGVWVAQTPSLSVVSWGKYAFDNDEELVRFLSLHGHTIKPLLDGSLYPAAEQYALELPNFPQEGSIVDVGDYIIVHF
jgi:hypothetical protein